MTPSSRAAAALFTACALTLAVASADDDRQTLDNLVQNIIGLRADVEGLDARLQRLESEHEARMSSLAQREGELAAQSERQELNIKQLDRKLVNLRQQTTREGVAAERLTPVLKQAIHGMREYVKTSLPFKRGERLAALKEIESQLNTGALKPSRLAYRLWSFYTDEISLTGDSALYRQPVLVAGVARLVDVARLGMMSLYFRADDGRFGYAAHVGDDWIFRYIPADAPADGVAALFGALRKQLDTGFYELPHPVDRKSFQQTGPRFLQQAEAWR